VDGQPQSGPEVKPEFETTARKGILERLLRSLTAIAIGIYLVAFVAALAYNLFGEERSTTSATVPRGERLGWDEFLYVMEHDEVERDACERVFDGDLDACYYTMGQVFVDSGVDGPDEYWPLRYRALTEPPSTTTSTTTPPRARRQYQANQYGCHDDGRCLDDYDTWCDETDLIDFEPTGESICPDSYDSALDDLIDRSE
jgi:hypothetical protein